MTQGESWRLFKVVLAASSLMLLLFLAPIVVGLVAGFLIYRTEPKTLEIRRVTVHDSSPTSANCRSTSRSD